MHVLEALPERSRMLAVDASLPVHSVISTVLSEQYQSQRQATGAEEAPTLSSGGMMRREGFAETRSTTGTHKPGLGSAAPGLPSDVLAEVCELDLLDNLPEASGQPEVSGDQQQSVRRWTSPDDGWGSHHAFPMQDLERMPMGMPVTVGELADFLAHAAEASNAEDHGDGDMLDWSLSQWRSHRMKQSGKMPATGSDDAATLSRLELEEGSDFCGPILVHRVPEAPPRPILCADDPDASLLKAVQLLLAYPNCDALPIVSPGRCTVVAHFTLSYCLAFILSRLRGSSLLPLANLPIRAQEGPAPPTIRKFLASASLESGSGSDCWAKPREQKERGLSMPWVLCQSQPLRELLLFFARTHHTSIPVVEDDLAKGGLLGVLSRRDLLSYLDLALQSARRVGSNESPVYFDVASKLEAVLETLRSHRPADEAPTQTCLGASVSFEKELTLKNVILRVLGAQNRKLLFVQDAGSGVPPKLLRIVSAGDIWRLLIGSGQEIAATSVSTSVTDSK